MSYSSRLLATNRLQNPIEQTAHGFSVGEVVFFENLNPLQPYQLAQADNAANCVNVMIVSFVADADHFYVTQTGFVSALVTGPYVTDTQYYLSSTNPGELTTIAPTGVGEVVLKCFVATSTTAGYFFGGSGNTIEPDTLFAWNVLNTTPVNMAANNGYGANAAGATTYILPANYAVGTEFIIVDHSGNGFVITQTLGGGAQQICDLGLASTPGAAGTTTTTVAGQAITLVAMVANGALRVTSSKGAFTYA